MTNERVQGHLIRACYNSMSLAEGVLTHASTNALRLSLTQSLRLLEYLQEPPEGGNVVTLHP